jgi:hypothetical protein
MSCDYSISLNGIVAAERNLEQAARRIAAPCVPAQEAPADLFSPSDLAAELLAADLAKTAVEANLQVISAQRELECESLDLFT